MTRLSPSTAGTGALTSLTAGDRPAAEAKARAAISASPADGVAWLVLLVLAELAGDSAAANQILQAAQAAAGAGALENAARQVTAGKAAHLAAAPLRQAALLLNDQRPRESVTAFQALLPRFPADAQLHFNLALAHRATGAMGAARHHLARAVIFDPGYTAAWSTLGLTALEAQDFATARQAFAAALKLDPAHVPAWVNLAGLEQSEGNPAAALAAAGRALALAPGLPQAQLNRAFSLLALGHLADGWTAYEARFAAADPGLAALMAAGRAWDGQPLPGGQELWVIGEQGIGDHLLFGTLLGDLAARVPRARIFVDPRLLDLFGRAFPGFSFAALPAPKPGKTQPCVGMASLARLFRPDLAGFGQGAYLIPDPARKEAAQDWLARLPEGLRVGLVWRGGGVIATAQQHYSMLEDWRELLARGDLTVIDLQYRPQPAEKAGLGPLSSRLHAMPGLDTTDDMDGVAALMASLDLVISADNTAANLAGALGLPVFRFAATRPWTMLGTDHLPWFAQTRMVIKDRAENFDDLARRILELLTNGTADKWRC